MYYRKVWLFSEWAYSEMINTQLIFMRWQSCSQNISTHSSILVLCKFCHVYTKLSYYQLLCQSSTRNNAKSDKSESQPISKYYSTMYTIFYDSALLIKLWKFRIEVVSSKYFMIANVAYIYVYVFYINLSVKPNTSPYKKYVYKHIYMHMKVQHSRPTLSI